MCYLDNFKLGRDSWCYFPWGKKRNFLRRVLCFSLCGRGYFMGFDNVRSYLEWKCWLFFYYCQGKPDSNYALGTIHLRHWQIFMIFDPYPLLSAVVLLPSVGKLLTPTPLLKNADVLNWWSLTVNLFWILTCGCQIKVALYFGTFSILIKREKKQWVNDVGIEKALRFMEGFRKALKGKYFHNKLWCRVGNFGICGLKKSFIL